MHRILLVAGVLAGSLVATSAGAGDLATKATTPASPYVPSPALEIYGGLSVVPHSIYGYGGGVYAFNRNLNQDGWLLRIAGGGGHYDYYRAVGLNQGVDFQKGTFSLGYQAFLGNVRISGYVGADVEHDANDDPLATVKGTEWGVRGQGEVFAPIGSIGYVYLLGTVSSVWNSYLAMGKLGFNLTNNISIGPELMGLGNKRFDSVRLGPFVSFAILPNLDLIVSGGYSWDPRRDSLNDNSGAYGNLHVRALF